MANSVVCPETGRNRCCINPDHLREVTAAENCANRGGRFAA